MHKRCIDKVTITANIITIIIHHDHRLWFIVIIIIIIIVALLVDKVADMVVDNMSNEVAAMVADMEVDKVVATWWFFLDFLVKDFGFFGEFLESV